MGFARSLEKDPALRIKDKSNRHMYLPLSSIGTTQGSFQEPLRQQLKLTKMIDQRIKVQTSFNNLCSPLEYHLCAALRNSSDNILKYWWCDGIDIPEINDQFTSCNITSIKQITTKAWIGPQGSDRYDVIIKLGRCSRRKALKGLAINDCLPYINSFDWIEINIRDNIMILQLN